MGKKGQNECGSVWILKSLLWPAYVVTDSLSDVNVALYKLNLRRNCDSRDHSGLSSLHIADWTCGG